MSTKAKGVTNEVEDILGDSSDFDFSDLEDDEHNAAQHDGALTFNIIVIPFAPFRRGIQRRGSRW